MERNEKKSGMKAWLGLAGLAASAAFVCSVPFLTPEKPAAPPAVSAHVRLERVVSCLDSSSEEDLRSFAQERMRIVERSPAYVKQYAEYQMALEENKHRDRLFTAAMGLGLCMYIASTAYVLGLAARGDL